MFFKSALYKLRKLKSSDPGEFARIFASLSKQEQLAVANHWFFQARDNQLPPDGDWVTWVLKPGRGFGKTFALARICLQYMIDNPDCIVHGVAQTQSDAIGTMIEGESGIINALLEWGWRQVDRSPGSGEFVYKCSPGRLSIRLGGCNSYMRFFSAETPRSLRGPQCHLAWLDELCSFGMKKDSLVINEDIAKQVWQQVVISTRLGDSPKILVSTTPKPLRFFKDIQDRPTTKVTLGSTYDNPHLSGKYKETIEELFRGTRYEQQELYGQESYEVPGALWNLDMIKYLDGYENITDIQQTVVAIDPAVTSSPQADETGIVVCSRGKGNTYYVVEDYSCRMTPEEWAKKAVQVYHEHEANMIIYETNQGGDLVTAALRNIDRRIPLRGVRASKGKYSRAEPISMLYEQGKVFHTKRLHALEEQMITYNPQMYKGSPDRLDALVWGLWSLSQKAAPNITWL